ncbi:MAG: phosphatase PAP2 family protein [Alphaproteobacteria bacterium]|nr:phosphatase PAP2 family protein [Alphaproteobacteria bacterium]
MSLLASDKVLRIMLSRFGIARLPRWVLAAILLSAGFAGFVILTGLMIGTPLAAPSERVSLALGFNAALPVLLGFVGYALAQVVSMATKRKFEFGPLGRAAAIDATVFMTFGLVVYFHFNLKMWIPLINPLRFDEAYMAADRFLEPVMIAFGWVRSSLPTEMPLFDQFYQLGFLLMFVISFAVLAVSRDRHYPHFVIGIMLVMSLGGVAYLIAPAVGPFLFEDGANSAATEAQAGMWAVYRQLVAAGPTWISENGSEYFTGALAAMPSLHVAHATVITYYVNRSGLAIRWPFMLLWAFILIESVVSRWHYLVDAPAGLLVALIAIVIANRICDEEAQTVLTEQEKTLD